MDQTSKKLQINWLELAVICMLQVFEEKIFQVICIIQNIEAETFPKLSKNVYMIS